MAAGHRMDGGCLQRAVSARCAPCRRFRSPRAPVPPHRPGFPAVLRVRSAGLRGLEPHPPGADRNGLCGQDTLLWSVPVRAARAQRHRGGHPCRQPPAAATGDPLPRCPAPARIGDVPRRGRAGRSVPAGVRMHARAGRRARCARGYGPEPAATVAALGPIAGGPGSARHRTPAAGRGDGGRVRRPARTHAGRRGCVRRPPDRRALCGGLFRAHADAWLVHDQDRRGGAHRHAAEAGQPAAGPVEPAR
jgi:hypothetical protein